MSCQSSLQPYPRRWRRMKKSEERVRDMKDKNRNRVIDTGKRRAEEPAGTETARQ